MVGRPDAALPGCGGDGCGDSRRTSAERRADRAMQRIADIGGAHLIVVPDIAFVRVETGPKQPDLAYNADPQQGLHECELHARG